MKVSTQDLEEQQVELTIEVPNEELMKFRKKVMKSLANEIRIHGFRKGKAPQKLIEQQVGKQYILDQTFEQLSNSSLREAMKQEDLTAVSTIDVDIVTLDEDKDVVFKATFTKYPTVELGDYTNLDIPLEIAAVSEEDVDKEVKKILVARGKIVNAPDDAVTKMGDVVSIDFTGYVDGEEFDGGKGADYPLDLGSGSFIGDFEEQLVGLKDGDEKEVSVTFPEDYHVKELAGKPALFKCKVKKIRNRELPELNDEFAHSIDANLKNVDDFRQATRDRLELKAKREAKDKQLQAAIDKIVEGMKVDVPEVMIETELDNIMNVLSLRLQEEGVTLDDYFDMTDTDAGQYRESQRDVAEKNVLAAIALDAIAKKEEMIVSDMDMSTEILMMAIQNNATPQEIAKVVKQKGMEHQLYLTVLRKKATTFITNHLPGNEPLDEENKPDNDNSEGEKAAE